MIFKAMGTMPRVIFKNRQPPPKGMGLATAVMAAYMGLAQPALPPAYHLAGQGSGKVVSCSQLSHHSLAERLFRDDSFFRSQTQAIRDEYYRTGNEDCLLPYAEMMRKKAVQLQKRSPASHESIVNLLDEARGAYGKFIIGSQDEDCTGDLFSAYYGLAKVTGLLMVYDHRLRREDVAEEVIGYLEHAGQCTDDAGKLRELRDTIRQFRDEVDDLIRPKKQRRERRPTALA